MTLTLTLTLTHTPSYPILEHTPAGLTPYSYPNFKPIPNPNPLLSMPYLCATEVTPLQIMQVCTRDHVPANPDPDSGIRL